MNIKPYPHQRAGVKLSKETRQKMSNSAKKRGSPWLVGATGSKCNSWKGNSVGYGGMHDWLNKNYGKADRCENKECVYPRRNKDHHLMIKPKRFEYALIHGKKYTKDRENYIMLCPSCHRKYDSGLIRILLTNR